MEGASPCGASLGAGAAGGASLMLQFMEGKLKGGGGESKKLLNFAIGGAVATHTPHSHQRHAKAD